MTIGIDAEVGEGMIGMNTEVGQEKDRHQHWGWKRKVSTLRSREERININTEVGDWFLKWFAGTEGKGYTTRGLDLKVFPYEGKGPRRLVTTRLDQKT